MFCVGIWHITENADYVTMSISSVDLEAGTVDVQATIHIDDNPVLGYSNTVDYCDRKEARKELKAKAKATIKEFKGKNCK